jgi:hypothetical protein
MHALVQKFYLTTHIPTHLTIIHGVVQAWVGKKYYIFNPLLGSKKTLILFLGTYPWQELMQERESAINKPINQYPAIKTSKILNQLGQTIQ